MNTRLKLCILLLLSLALNLHAEWGRAADEYFRLPLSQNTRLLSDGNGGCWATAYPAGLCHVDRDGNLTWGDEPFGLPGDSYDLKSVLADNGDVILAGNIVYEANDPQKVYLQRVNLDQELRWGEDGIAIDTSSRIQWLIGAYAGPIDNTYLIHWIRSDEDFNNMDGRLQLINGDGDFLWDIGGIGLNWSHSNSHFVVSSDQCVIAAQNISPTPSVEIRKINPEGERLWNSRFSTLWEDVRQRTISDAESDREGGVILVYEYLMYESVDDSIMYFGINAMRISGDGDSLWTRHIYEREMESRYENFGYIKPIINYAGSGAFLVAWADWPHAFQVVALDTDGEQPWDEPVDIQLNPVGYGALDAVDSDNGVCYVWRDVDHDRENNQQLSGQRISVDGERLWGDRGRAIQAHNVDRLSITTDGNGGAITVAEFAFPTIQMINRNGEIGVVLEVGVDDKSDKKKSSKQPPELFIYPNPGNSQFRFKFETDIPNELFRYGIYNLTGRSIKSGMMAGGQYMINDLSQFSSGEYILLLQSSRTTVSKRFSLIK